MKTNSLTILATLLVVKLTGMATAADHPPLAIAPFDAQKAE